MKSICYPPPQKRHNTSAAGAPQTARRGRSRARRLSAAVLVLLSAVLLAAGQAPAQTTAPTGLTLTVSPTTIYEGQTVQFTVTATLVGGTVGQNVSLTPTLDPASTATGTDYVVTSSIFVLTIQAGESSGMLAMDFMAVVDGASESDETIIITISQESINESALDNNISITPATITVRDGPPPTAPGAPTNLTATVNTEFISLRWNAPSDTGGAAITGYRVEVSTNDGATWTDLDDDTGTTRTNYYDRNPPPGQTRHYRVSAINTAGTGPPSNAANARANNPATGKPEITGSPVAGQTLSVNLDGIMDADGLPMDASGYTITWYLEGEKEDTATTWVVPSGEVGSEIHVDVYFQDELGLTEYLSSDPVTVVSQANTLATGAPTIAGTPESGAELQAGKGNIADANGLPTSDFQYQWQREKADGSDWEDLTGRTQPFLLVGLDLVGRRLRVAASFTDNDGYDEVRYSAPTTAVRAATTIALSYDGSFTEDTRAPRPSDGDGTVAGSLVITLAGETFSADAKDHVTVSNVPAGLMATVARPGPQRVTLRFEGQAFQHANQDDVSNLTVTFGNGAFSGNNASRVTGASKSDLTIDFTGDPPPPAAVSIAAGTSPITEGADATFTLTVTPAPASNLTVNLSIATVDDGDAAVTTTDTLTVGTSGTGTYIVNTPNDELDEPNGSITVTVAPGAGYAPDATSRTATVTVNDDEPGRTLSIAAQTLPEEAGETTFEVTASGLTTLPYSCWAFLSFEGETTATWEHDFFGLRSHNFHGNQDGSGPPPNAPVVHFRTSLTATVAVTVRNDNQAEEDEVIEIRCKRSDGKGHAAAGTITITDNDAAPTAIELTLDPATVAESGGAQEVTVTATIDGTTTFGEAQTVDVNLAAGSATQNTDYTVTTAPGSLTIPAGMKTGRTTFTITPEADTVDDPGETVTVGGTLSGVTVTPATLTIAEAPSFSIGEATGAEDGGPLAFTVSLSPALTSGQATVSWAASTATGDTATAGTDYTDRTGTLTFGVGETSQMVNVPLVNDALDEADETFTVTLSNPTPGTVIGTATATGTITDDDPLPALSVSGPASVREGDTGDTAPLTFTVTLDPVSGREVSVDYATDDGTATADEDYTDLFDKTLTFAPGETRKTVDVTIFGDEIVEGDETFSLMLADPQNATLPISTATGTITDDDIPGLAVSRTTLSLNEKAPGNEGSFTVALAKRPDGNVTVAVTAAPASGVVTLSAASLQFTPDTWDTPQTVTVTAVDDAIDNDGDRRATVTVAASGSGYDGVRRAVAVTVSDDVAGVKLSTEALTVAESGANDAMDYTVVLNTDPGTGASVQVAFASARTGIATVAVKGEAIPRPTVCFVGGSSGVSDSWNTPRTLTVSAVNDDVDNLGDARTVQITHTVQDGCDDALGTPTSSAYAGVSAPSLTVTVTDDDVPALSIADASSPENGGAVQFTVSMTPLSEKTIAVSYATSDDNPLSAAAGADYRATNGTLTFAPRQASRTLDVPIINDNVDEGEGAAANETFTMTLSGATNGATIADADATGTIVDDDAPPTGITLTLMPQTVTERGGAQQVTATVGPAGGTTFGEGRTVFVDVAPSGTAATGDYALIPASDGITLPAAAASASTTFTITPVADTVTEGSETVVFRAQSIGLVIVHATLTIVEAPTFSIADASAAEGEPMTFTVSLEPPSDGPVQVSYATSSGAALEGTDYRAASGTLTFAPDTTSRSFTVATIEDRIDDEDEAFTVTLSNPTGSDSSLGNAVIGAATATGAIEDDDDTPTAIALTLAPPVVAESAGTQTVTVTAAVQGGTTFGAARTVSLLVHDGSAGLNTDYQFTPPAAITIPAGMERGSTTFTITPVDDGTGDDPGETVTVSGTLSGVTVTAATLTIVEAPTFSIANAEADEGEPMTFTVSLEPASDGIVRVAYATSSGAALEGTDYRAASGTLTFPPGTTSRSFTVATIEDRIDDEGEAFTVTLSNPAGSDSSLGNAVIGDATATGAIEDDDATPTDIALTLAPPVVAESAGTQTVTVTAAVQGGTTFGEDKTVSVAVAPGGANSATETADYTASAPAAITIPAGTSSGSTTFTITPVDDAADDSGETVTVSGTLASITVTAAALTIVEAPTFSIGDATSAGESGSLAFTVRLDPAITSGRATVRWATSSEADDTATAGRDYTRRSGTLTFGAGVTEQTVRVPIRSDRIDEADETFTLTLSDVTGGDATIGDAVIGDATARGTIADDDDPPAIRALTDPRALIEGDVGDSAAMTFTVQLAAASEKTVTVAYATADVTATAGADYVAASGTLTFKPGETRKTVAVTIRGDETLEDDETFTLTLSNPVHTTSNPVHTTLPEPPAATGTIVDDDVAALAVDRTALTLNEAVIPKLVQARDTTSHRGRFAVTLLTRPRSNVTVSLASDASGVVRLSRSSLTFTPMNYRTPQRVTVRAIDNAVADGERLVRVTATANGGGYGGESGVVAVTVVDDDGAGVRLSHDALTFSESGGFRDTRGWKMYRVVLNADPGDGNTVTVTARSTSDAFTVHARDWHAPNGEMTFKGGDCGPRSDRNSELWCVPQVVRLVGVDDAVDNLEEPRTGVVTHTVSGYGGVTSGPSLTVRVTDNEQPVLRVADATSAGESGRLAFTVGLSVASEKTIAVDWATGDSSPVSAVAGEDYRAASGTLTFRPGETQKTVSVAILPDRIDDDGETFTIGLSDATSGATIAKSPAATGTITDDDEAPTGIALSVSPGAVSEGGGAQQVTVTATVAGDTTFAADRTVTLSVTGGGINAATADTDYTASTPAAITIPAGTSSGETTFTLTPVDDTVDDNGETVAVSGSTGGGVSVAPIFLFIVEAPTFSIADAGSSAGESGSLAFVVSLKPPVTSGSASVRWAASSASGDTATANRDYTAGAGTLRFTRGQTVKTVSVPIRADSIDEANETFTVTLSDVTGGDAIIGAAVIGDATATGTITDDDDPPAFRAVADRALTEGDVGDSADMTFTVQLAAASGKQVTVNYTTGGGTATAGTDYTTASGTLTFAPSETSKTVAVAILGDAAVEGDETFVLTLSSPVNAALPEPATATGTITDNDRPGLTVNPATLSVNEAAPGNAATFTVVLDKQPSGNVTVALTADPAGGVVTLSPAALPFTATNWDTPQTVTVTGVNDDVRTGNRRAVVSAAASGSGYDGQGGRVTVTVVDDDVPGVKLSAESLSIAENGATGTYTVQLNTDPGDGRTATVTVTSSNPGVVTVGDTDLVTAGDQNTLTFTGGASGTWGAAQTVTLSAVNDAVDNHGDARTATVRHRVSGYAGVGSSGPAVAVTVTDDDTAMLSIADVTSTGESGSLTFTVTLNPASDDTVRVTYATSDGTATAGADYSARNGTLTFSRGQTEKTITVPIVQDNIDDEGETFTVTLSDPTGGATLATGTGTITDDDGTPTAIALSLSPAAVAESGGAQEVTVTAAVQGGTTFGEDKTVTVTVAPGGANSATETADYTASAPAAITIPAGTSSGSTTFTITPVDDAADDSGETVTVSGALSPPDNTVTVAGATLTIAEAPTFSIADATSTGESGSLAFTVRLDPAIGSGSASVRWATSSEPDDTATANRDYTARSGSLTFGAGVSEQTVRVPIRGDSLDEANETFTVTLSGVSGGDRTIGDAVIGAATATGTITDDAAPAIRALTDPPALTEGDVGDSAAMTFTVRLAAASEKTVTVAWATSDGTATAGADYTAASGTLTFAPGETSKTVTVAILGDAAVEGDETFTLTLNSPMNAALPEPATATGTIVDDDVAALSVDRTALTLNEAVIPKLVQARDTTSHRGRFAVTLLTRPRADVTVSLAAEPAGVVRLSRSSLTFTPVNYRTPQRVTVKAIDNGLADGERLVRVTATANGGGYGGESGVVAVTVVDDDGAGVRLSHDALTLSESGGFRDTRGWKMYRVVLNADPGDGNTVTVTARSTSDAFTVHARDWHAPNGEMTFKGGDCGPRSDRNSELWCVPQVVRLVGVDDAVDNLEEPRTGVVTHTVSGYGGVTSGPSLTVRVTDNEQPVLRVEDAESAGESGRLTFTVGLSVASEKTIAVDWATGDSSPVSAVAGEDYRAASGRLTFRPGETEKTVHVAILQDDINDDGETFSIGLTGATGGATIAKSPAATGTITDDDGAPAAANNAPEAAPCVADLGALAAAPVSLDGEAWAAPACRAHHRDNRPARYFRFTLAAPATVSLALTSPRAASLFVSQGTPANGWGTPPQGGMAQRLESRRANGRLVHEAALTASLALAAGSYTAEVVLEEEGINPAASFFGLRIEASAPAAANGPPTVSDTSAFANHLATAGERFSLTLPAADAGSGDGGPYAYVLWKRGAGVHFGENGLSFDPATRTVSGTPQAAGTFDLTYQVHDGDADRSRADSFVEETALRITVRAAAAAGGAAADSAPVALRVASATVGEDAGQVGVLVRASRPTDGLYRCWGARQDPRTTATPDVDFSAARQRDAVTLDFSAATTATFHVIVLDDVKAEADEAVTVRCRPEADLSDATRGADGLLTIIDDDDAAVAVADARANESAGTIAFTLTLDVPARQRATVAWATADGTATAGADYAAASGTAVFAPGDTAHTVTVAIHDDAHDEGEETFRLLLSAPVNLKIGDGEAVGTIVNSDPLPKAWTARFGRSVAVHVLDAVEARLDGASESYVQLGGQRLGGDPAVHQTVRRLAPDHSPSTGSGQALWAEPGDPAGQGVLFRDLLLGSAFHLVSNDHGEAAGPRLSAWGRVAASRFEGRADTMSLDGTVTTATLGVDGTWKRWLTGLVVAYSEGDGSFAHDVRGGDLASSLTSVHPWAAYTLSDRVRLWGLVGYGSGSLHMRLADRRATDTDLTMRMGALGVRGSLLQPAQPSGLELALRSDVLWMVMDSAAADNLAATEADVSRLRLVLEGSRSIALAGGGSFTPSLEVGLRRDGGDAETGTGLEVGGRLRYASAWGLSLEASVRGLLAHEASDYTEWGASGALRFDPGRQGRGFTASLTPAWGAASSGVSRLWGQPGTTGLPGADALAPGAAGRLDAELGYGLATLQGRGLLTPYARVALTEGADQAWHLGTRLALTGALNLSLEASRRAREGVAAHELALRANVGW